MIARLGRTAAIALATALSLALGACSEESPVDFGADGGDDAGAGDTDSETESESESDSETESSTDTWENPGCEAAANIVEDDLRLDIRVELTDVANDIYDIAETLTVTPTAAGEALTFFGEAFEMGEASAGYAYDGHTATFCVGAFEAGADVSVEARFRVTAASLDESIMGAFGLSAHWNGDEVVVGPFTEPYNSPRWILSPQSLGEVDTEHDDSPSVSSVQLTVVAPDDTWTVVGPGGHGAVSGLEHSFAMDVPMPLYALSFAASPDYETFLVGTSESGVEVWAAVTPDLAGAAEEHFPAAVTAIDDMERDIGPYAFGDTLFLAEIPGLGGGMEHVSAIWLGSDVLTDGSGDFVVAHETVHHWWGDNVRFADWPHFWLAEGFDEWSTNFNVMADIYGADDFEANVKSYRSYAAQIMSGEWGTVGPLRFSDDADMGDIFDGSANPAQIYVYYYYGAVFLEMVNLRLVRDFSTDLNTLASAWFDEKSLSSATTEELLAFLGEETGDLSYWTALFDDWVYASPTPTLRYGDYSYADGTASFTLTRTGGADQRLDALDVVFTASGTDYAATASLFEGTDSVTVIAPLPTEPDAIAIDPDGYFVLSLEEGSSWSGPAVTGPAD